MKEKFLFSNMLSATTTAADVKALVDSFYEANKLSWQNFKHICTDGDPAIIASNQDPFNTEIDPTVEEAEELRVQNVKCNEASI